MAVLHLKSQLFKNSIRLFSLISRFKSFLSSLLLKFLLYILWISWDIISSLSLLFKNFFKYIFVYSFFKNSKVLLFHASVLLHLELTVYLGVKYEAEIRFL